MSYQIKPVDPSEFTLPGAAESSLRGDRRGRKRKLTDAQAKEVRALYRKWLAAREQCSVRALSRKYGLTDNTVRVYLRQMHKEWPK